MPPMGRLYRYVNRHQFAQDVIKACVAEASSTSEPAGTELQAVKVNHVEAVPASDGQSTMAVPDCVPCAAKPTTRHVWLKYLHAAFMIYSYAMIVGAGKGVALG